jgi:hypothetical protein
MFCLDSRRPKVWCLIETQQDVEFSPLQGKLPNLQVVDPDIPTTCTVPGGDAGFDICSESQLMVSKNCKQIRCVSQRITVSSDGRREEELRSKQQTQHCMYVFTF